MVVCFDSPHSGEYFSGINVVSQLDLTVTSFVEVTVRSSLNGCT